MRRERVAREGPPHAKRPREDAEPTNAALALTSWAECATILKQALHAAGTDAPNSDRPPYSVSQLLGWGSRFLARPSTAAAAPSSSVLLRFCGDSLRRLIAHMHGRVESECARVEQLLQTPPKASRWEGLPLDLRQMLLLRHGPRAIVETFARPAACDPADLGALVTILRTQRSVLSRLLYWQTLLLPVEQPHWQALVQQSDPPGDNLKDQPVCVTAKVVAVRGAVPRAESAATHLVTGAQSDAHWKLEVQLARRPEQQGGGEALRVERVTFREDLHHIASELPEETHRLLEQIATCEAPLMPPAAGMWRAGAVDDCGEVAEWLRPVPAVVRQPLWSASWQRRGRA
ncbi:hypothetical protein AB1Y20_004719 [Prymnesium parvum]|uniref:Uncharacterized protein n=1 Tax=Prymnesium parvum TaxID=97485 RepID=A0AB34J012_PRYPA